MPRKHSTSGAQQSGRVHCGLADNLENTLYSSHQSNTSAEAALASEALQLCTYSGRALRERRAALARDHNCQCFEAEARAVQLRHMHD